MSDDRTAYGLRHQVENYFERLAERLLGESQAAASLTSHRGIYGTAAEDGVRSFLRNHLPERYGIGEGHIVSFYENSAQVDAVIFDGRECFKIPITEASTLYSVEGVYAAIEIKSSPSRTTGMRDVVKRAVANIESVKKVAVPFPFSMTSQLPASSTLAEAILLQSKGQHFASLMFPVGAILILGTGSKFETVRTLFKEEQSSVEFWHNQPDIFCVLDEKNSGLCGSDLVLKDDRIARRFWIEECETPGQTLATFLYWLVHKMTFERIIERPLFDNRRSELQAIWPSVLAPVVRRIRVDAHESQRSWPWDNDTRIFEDT